MKKKEKADENLFYFRLTNVSFYCQFETVNLNGTKCNRKPERRNAHLAEAHNDISYAIQFEEDAHILCAYIIMFQSVVRLTFRSLFSMRSV